MKFNRYALSDLATIKYGKNQKKVLSENGNIPIYGTGGLMGYATTALYDKPSVLIGRKGTIDRKSTRLNSSHYQQSRMPSSA